VPVPVFVEVDGSVLLAGHEAPVLHVDFCLYALGAGGSVAAALAETAEIDLARLRPAIEKSGIKFLGELALPPGEHTLRVLVQNPATRRVGLRSLPLTVPAEGGAGALPAPPLFGDPGDGWLLVRSPRGVHLPGGTVEGEAPAARPILAPGAEASFRLAARKLPEGVELAAELLGPEGRRAAELPARVTARQPTEVAGLEILSVAFAARGLRAGAYDLQVVARGDASAGTAEARSPALPVLVDARAGRVWAELTPAEGAPVPAASEPAGRGRRKRRAEVGPLVASYRAALGRLAAGEEEAARAAVAGLETGALEGEARLEVEELAEAEFEVAHQLARSDPESLVPLLMLYQELYRDYLAERRYQLSTHAGQMVFGLAALYVKQADSEPARKLAADFLAGLTHGLTGTGMTGFSQRALRRALELDQRNAVSLLFLAVQTERQGKAEETVELLERLLRAEPEHVEARLRLARNLIRMGKEREAERRLRELARPGAAAGGWLALVYQELARLQIGQGRLDEAERAIAEGLGRLPGDEKLLILSGLVRDLRGDPAGARSVLDGLQPRPGDGGGPARFRYTQVPEEALEQVWQEMRASAARRLPALAAALGTRAGEATPGCICRDR
jgi:tetratricopeptide (TPR) repeat protein